MKKNYLLTPGPTAVPTDVALEMARPMIHHRTPVYVELFKQVSNSLKSLFRTKNDVYVLTSSGTGAMEAAVINTLSAGDTVLVVKGGKFGERWGKIAEAYGVNVIYLDVEWGKAVDPLDIKKYLDMKNSPISPFEKGGVSNVSPFEKGGLKGDLQIKAVFTTLCETSTGARTDIQAIGKIVKDSEAILVVDAISGIGAEDFWMDDWHVDVAVTGSQKALMLPPGLAFISLSDKAWDVGARRAVPLPNFYLNLKKAKKSLEGGETPFTPAISLVIGLNKSLQMIHEEGLENVIKRHQKLAKAVREASKAMGLELFAPDAPSNAVTPVRIPAGIDCGAFIKKLKSKYGVTIIGGQEHLKGKIFRIAHLGYMDIFDILIAISAIEMTLVEMGYVGAIHESPLLGKGVSAAERVLME
ncbi:MAG: alanine--glyoxylate aminotransferase family protein [bacterium]